MVERNLAKVDVVGSSPIIRLLPGMFIEHIRFILYVRHDMELGRKFLLALAARALRRGGRGGSLGRTV